MPAQTSTLGFNINTLVNNNGRFTLEVQYYYNFDIDSGNYTNTEIVYHQMPIEEIWSQVSYNATTSEPGQCEINSTNKCLLRYSSDMFNLQQVYSDPVILFQYLANNILV